MQSNKRMYPPRKKRPETRERKRPVLILLALVALISISIIGTLAYFTDQKNVDNTFTVGKVEIELNEPKWVEKGHDTTPPVLVPGVAIDKDPTVTVKQASEDCYVRVKLEMPAALKAVLADLTISQGWAIDQASEKIENGTYSVYYNYTTKVTKNATQDTVLAAVFTEVKPKTDASDQAWAAVKDLGQDMAKITVKAEAIQSASFQDASAAWAQFPTQ